MFRELSEIGMVAEERGERKKREEGRKMRRSILKAKRFTATFFPYSLLLFFFIIIPQVYASKTVIKFGTLAPAGSIWVELWDEFTKKVEQKIGGKVKFIAYPGGVMGDEEEMIRKIRIGQLHAGGFTINGLKKIAPELGILDVPFLFKNYKEVDYITEKFIPEFEKYFEKRGFVLLLFTEQGFVYFYSKRDDVKGFRDLAKTRLWAWKGERIMIQVAKILGTSPIYVPVPDVLSGLETGLIESFQTSPMACLSLQWCKLVRVMINFPYRFEPGVIVIYKKVWEKLPDDVKEVMKNEAKNFFKKFKTEIRKSQHETIEKLKKMGIKMVKPSESEIRWFEKEVRSKLWYGKDAGYPHELLRKIESELKNFRGK